MNITCSNFKDSLDEVESAIQSSTFLAIDGEFTGLNSGQGWNAFDTPSERYEKIRSGALEFLMVQFGLSTFKQAENGRFLQKTFNFYVFPRPLRKGAPDPKFRCQASSLDFLVSQGFDFNRLFKDGISYLKPKSKKKLMEHVIDRQKQRESNKNDPKIKRDRIPVPEEHKEFIESQCLKVDEFTKSEGTELELQKCNAFLRLLLFQEIGIRFPNTYLETKMDSKKDRFIVVMKGKEEDLIEMEAKRKEEEIKEVEDAEGFYKVIRMISNSGKPVVGHNMTLDLCHVIHQFHCDLPKEFSDFKQLAHQFFPSIMDTKLMANTHPFKDKVPDSTLDKLLNSLSQAPFSLPDVQAEDNSSAYKIGEKLHEAGYDAYVTGLAFITMAKYLGTLKEPPTEDVFNQTSVLEPFMNKLYMQCSQDIACINLIDDEVVPIRDHVFHVTFPSTWKRTEILDLFSPFGRVYIAWIDDSSAWVALVDKHHAAVVTSRISSTQGVTVVTYREHKGLDQSRKRTHPSEAETLPVKRKRSGSMTRSSSSFDTIPEEEENGGSWFLAITFFIIYCFWLSTMCYLTIEKDDAIPTERGSAEGES